MRNSKDVSLVNINRRLRKRLKTIQALAHELVELEDLIAAPTPEELAEMVHRKRPLSLEALLLGVISLAAFHVEKAGLLIEDYGPLTQKGVAQAAHGDWRRELGENMRFVARNRAQRSLAEPADPGGGPAAERPLRWK